MKSDDHNAEEELSGDYSLYYGLLQQTFDQMNDKETEVVNNEEQGNKQGNVKTKGLKEILSSLILIEEQEKTEKIEWEKAQEEDKMLLEENYKKRTKAMMDYQSGLVQFDEELDQSSRVRNRKSRAVTNAAVVSAIAADSDSGPATKATGSTAGSGAGPQRRLWVKSRSTDWWDKCNSADFPEEEFKKAFRMGKDTFELICNELTSAVAKENTMLRDAVPVRQRVAVCIWRLATGEPLRLVSRRFGLGISTCHKLVLEVCSAIKTVLMPKYLQWPDDESIRMIKDEFGSVSGIPNVVGSMYTTHIPIIAPKISVAAYFNKRHTERNQKTSYSITVQGVVDPRGVFTDVCIGWPGSMPDDQVLEKSALYQRASNGLLKDVWIVGSAGYPLMDWVLVPYTQPHLTWTQHAFNEKIGEVQRVASDAFARLKGRWACLQKRTEVKLQDLPVVLGACCVLHNICELRNEEIDPELMIELMDDEMVPEIGLRSAIAMKARDAIAHNLLHHNHAGTSFLS
ncbi:putative harbinger transposase-derived nuclease domain-containing protein [Helianthus annuus]|nr:putative harbinger transposase-derived nuclease domain-containing protein [Helianthus annuus]KAJ0541380.1 putative harbinger transposase-derived nuclease domain-containing protein [Helianthus annuus]KAJ0706459.1 putative harbinger transposase-derived nuclease domain-containing protein [Helianthus annuus]